MTCLVEAQSPSLSVSLSSPETLQLSWPSNFTTWQLMSTTNNLESPSWRPLPLPPFSSNTAFVVHMPIAETRRYFRLQRTDVTGAGGTCAFQANPPVINSGESSTLTWCSQPGYTYRIGPGPGIVTGGSVVVSPTNTTVYSLTASNALGIAAVKTTTVICNPCGWLQLSNLDATFVFEYSFSKSTADYNFNISHNADITFHLSRIAATDTDAYFFGFTTADPVLGTSLDYTSMKDQVDDKTGPKTFTTKEFGGPLAPSLHDVSTISMHLTCTTVDFSFNVLMDTTEVSDFGTFNQSDGVGTGQATARPIYVIWNSIRGEAKVPAAYPPLAGDYFVPSSDVGKQLFTTGTATAPNAGEATISWSFYPPQ